MVTDFCGKNVLITGASKRIGASCARLLHEKGCNVILHYNTSRQEALELCAQLNQERPDSARVMQADLLNREQLRNLAHQASGAWGGLDVLINNASSFYPTALAAVTEDQWDELLGSNLKAPFFLTQALSSVLLVRQGCVVNIIDIHAERGLKGYPVYSIAKAGLAAMTKVLAKELGPSVRVNGVAPGAIIWPEFDMSEEDKNEILQRVALHRHGQPADIAKAVLFLVRDAEYVTGQILSVDGGRTLFC
ncbi:MAG: pteridine reductase [Methylococcaceae bacterium]|jgi:pteridine reductase|nr:pteridine reductase [Methylococcaceae bacterium]MDZ4157029.1 pteridine reductase [Methylococcales bacterium]MDP2394218.1 pteridine reductase [Methylococcaceae bacterium]MDP3020046.1 pteridine reductase [Methylococcaceae bacterium]MDP3388788.1 pteridine reductase [Methylococcaceae bacterium]